MRIKQLAGICTRISRKMPDCTDERKNGSRKYYFENSQLLRAEKAYTETPEKTENTGII